MPNIDWSESTPQDVESAGLGAQRIQSLKTAIRTGLDGEHVWPSGGGDAGGHRLGSGRPYYGVQSLVSSSGTDGRLMVTSDTSRLFHVGSAGTMFLGSQRAISAGSAPVGGQTFVWVEEFGTVGTLGALTTTVTFPNSGFSGKPFVFLMASAEGVGGASFLPYLKAVTPTNFAMGDGFNSTYTLYWRSIGTRAL